MSTVKRKVKPELLHWARQRGGYSHDQIRKKFSQWEQWLSGDKELSFAQINKLAEYTHTSFWDLISEHPPKITLPITDFRLGKNGIPSEPSQNLLDTIYLCQQRQLWYKEYAQAHGILPKVSIPVSDQLSDKHIAERITCDLEFELETRREKKFTTQGVVRKYLIEKMEDNGVLVVANSIVGNNSSRRLDLDEARGFTLHDDLVPLIFINTSDTQAGQIFSLCHELAHLYIGRSGLSGEYLYELPTTQTHEEIEMRCNNIASEVIAPQEDVAEKFNSRIPLDEELDSLSRHYLCSPLVILLQLHEMKKITENFSHIYREESARMRKLIKQELNKAGGDFFKTLPIRSSKRFSQALISSTLENDTSYPEALRLLAISSKTTFDTYCKELGYSSVLI